MANNNNGGVFIAGMLVGTAIGTIAGVLAAPRSGKETRRLLKKSADALPEMAEDLATTLQLQADRLSDSTRRNWQDTLDRLKEAIAAGIEASQLDPDSPRLNATLPATRDRQTTPSKDS